MMRLFNLSGSKSQTKGRSKSYLFACLGIMGLISVWAVASMIALGVDCSASDYIRSPSLAQCSSQVSAFVSDFMYTTDMGSIYVGKSLLALT